MAEINPIWDNDYIVDCMPNFSANMEMARHRWYDFKEGFSSSLVERAIREAIKERDLHNSNLTVLDPFSGSGTSVLTALQNGCNAIGFEVNPFMSFVGRTKCIKKRKEKEQYLSELRLILSSAPYRKRNALEKQSTFSSHGDEKKWLFNKDVLQAFEAINSHIAEVEEQDIFKLALISAAMGCCNAKKDGKCLRYLKNWRDLNYSGKDLRTLFAENAKQMIEDIDCEPLIDGTRKIYQGDARKLIKDVSASSVDLIVFSPPYLNSFDYSDIYRPEMFLGGYVKSNSELMEIRKETIRSHVQCKWDSTEKSDLSRVKIIVNRLCEKKELLWSDYIPQMVSLYFCDMADIIQEAYRVAKENAKLWFVVSTSAYAGVEIPVDLILAEIAIKKGWQLENVNALRQLRTSSQCVDINNNKVKLRESLVICRK